MERLRIAILLAAVVATGQNCRGQQMPSATTTGSSAAPVESQYFAVIGDVRNFNYFELADGNRITVREAVLNAGLFADSANVSVIRSSQDRAIYTQMISTSTPDSGEPVMHGDVLVVQSMQPLNGIAVQKAAALRVDSRVILIALADETVAIGDVLEQTGNLPLRDRQLKMAFRFQGTPAIPRPVLADRVAHGDVITLTGSASMPKGFGRMAPTFSEWQASSRNASPQSSPSSSSLAANGSRLAVAEEGSAGDVGHPPFQIPLATQTTDEQVPMEEPAELQHRDMLSAPSPSDRAAAANLVPIYAVSQADRLATSEDSVVPETAPSITDVAPLPPVEVPVVTDTTSTAGSDSLSAWNMVFIGGLMLAGALILAGSLRADEENAADSIYQSEQRRALTESSGILYSPANSEAAVSSEDVSEKKFRVSSIPAEAMVAEPLHQTIAEKNTVTENSKLVETHEWFGGDWRAHPGGSTEAAGEFFTTAQPTSATDVRFNLPETSEFVTAASLQTESLKHESVGASVSDAAGDRPECSPDSPRSDDTLSELEDLLQNRIPVDLCEARLPLKIALFGKAAGPRRLRIDAAHTRVPGPHMNLSNERKRDESVAAAASRVNTQPYEGAAARSLDRALQSLQNRTDS